MVNGILYFSVPDNVWAVDARFGRTIWHYERKSEGDHIGHRGLAMYKNWLYFTTADAHLVCLDAKDGSVRWMIELADMKLGYYSTMAPLVIRDHIIVGVSGDSTDIRGILQSVDPETGTVQWRWYTEPDAATARDRPSGVGKKQCQPVERVRNAGQHLGGVIREQPQRWRAGR